MATIIEYYIKERLKGSTDFRAGKLNYHVYIIQIKRKFGC